MRICSDETTEPDRSHFCSRGGRLGMIEALLLESSSGVARDRLSVAANERRTGCGSESTEN